jgi:hypothetical protein
MEEKPKSSLKRDSKGRLVKGTPPGPGRPPGTLDFKTKWYAFLEKVAKKNNLTIDEVDEQMMMVAFNQAKKGNYNFYKDAMDRVYGKPKENVDVSQTGEITINIVKYE